MKMWLDDERNPDDPYIQDYYGADPGMLWVKTYDEAVCQLDADEELGPIEFISFDNELATGKTGYDLAKWIKDRASKGVKPPEYRVHSDSLYMCREISLVIEESKILYENYLTHGKAVVE